MNNKLTYKIQEILSKNDYTEVIIKDKNSKEEVSIKDANTKFRYELKKDKGYLSFGSSQEYTVCKVDDESIKEVIVNNNFLSIETEEKSYYCKQDRDKLFY